MDTRFLTLMEFQNVYFYRFITLAIFVTTGVLLLFIFPEMKRSEISVVVPVLFILWGRFAVEYVRLKKCGPAFIHNDELVISRDGGHRQIPLTRIRSVTSKHSLFMVRRYRSWTDHLAFLQVTLNNGERVYTLAEGAVFEYPAGKKTLAAIQAAVLAAKTKSLTSRQASHDAERST
ncbi:hypothetical protein MT1_1706 [Pseudomonas sp. MT-1]|uniref:hypothetical protein n=1 Tax=Stutzerimonas stutzeri TaxID=316 RepID=UPI000535A971|nr:hypothetical protein [Stutzerimonas stutzeri]MCQ4285203.1 hypothetical protein [Stutzerimonas stutzeri]BAP78884.1 hypothetical protein MT1_1706 [Pseudomonas sp. MT-1]